jgi:hypothetical protein
MTKPASAAITRAVEDMAADDIVWESDRRLSPTARRACATVTFVGLVAPAVLGLLYLTAGWGELGNPWWHPLMTALVVGLPAAAIAGPVLAHGGVHATVTAGGGLYVHRSRKTSVTDLRAFDRVTVKRERSRGSKGATVETIIVNGWRSGDRKPVPVTIGVLSRAQERDLREAIRAVRAAEGGHSASG